MVYKDSATIAVVNKPVCTSYDLWFKFKQFPRPDKTVSNDEFRNNIGFFKTNGKNNLKKRFAEHE